MGIRKKKKKKKKIGAQPAAILYGIADRNESLFQRRPFCIDCRCLRALESTRTIRQLNNESTWMKVNGHRSDWSGKKRRPFCATGAAIFPLFNCWLICINQAQRGRVSNRLRFVTCRFHFFLRLLRLVLLLLVTGIEFQRNERWQRVNYLRVMAAN